jgi:hypothetical protein
MRLDLHWFADDPTDLDEWDTTKAQADDDLRAELAAQAREDEWTERQRD